MSFVYGPDAASLVMWTMPIRMARTPSGSVSGSVELRGTLVEEGGHALVEVGAADQRYEQRQLHAVPLDHAGLQAEVDGTFGGGDRERGVAGDPFGQRHGRGEHVGRRHDLLDQSDG